MKNRLLRRALVALAAFGLLALPMAAPARADYDGDLPNMDRNHTGLSVWAPWKMDFNSGWDSNANRAWMVIGFAWQNPQQKSEVGQGVAIEFNAEVDCNWARVHYQTWKEGYQGNGWETNIPGAALPYEDTILKEPCEDGELDGRGKFGFGVLNPQALVHGQDYWAKFAFDTKPGLGFCNCASNVKLRVKTGPVYNSDKPEEFPEIPPHFEAGDCYFNNTEIADWNIADDAHLAKRQEAGYCAWIDWTHHVPGTFTTGSMYDPIDPNKLFYWSFESPSSATGTYLDQLGTGYATQPSAFKARICAPGAAFHGNCYTQFNKGTGYWASIWQDAYWAVWDTQYTAEVAVRCPVSNSGACSVGTGVRGLRSLSDGDFSWNWVPDDGYWYICRMDADHITNNASYGIPIDDSIRWEIINSTGENLDVDFGFLGGKTAWQDPEKYVFGIPQFGVGQAEKGNNCTKQV